MHSYPPIFKHVLANGLTILVRQTTAIPKVSINLFYNVGSKDEKSGQKGIAHLIEHMIFKGTDKLSESDINLITSKLSGYCNAFTSYDYTGYVFDFPTQYWHEAMPIMADCMRNCTIKQEFLNSEMKAVIQELKMYRDNYSSSLIEHMISAIFDAHPYHFPVIGFKQDLWSVERSTLLDFYHKHYVPNNATLVVVGDVDPQDVIKQATQHFGSIPADPTYKKESFYVSQDLLATTVSIYRDVQQPNMAFAFQVPGAREKNDYMFDVLTWILGSGKASRLYKKLVDELQWATEIETFFYDLADQGLFFIYCQTKPGITVEQVKKAILDECASIVAHGFAADELERACKQTQADFFAMLENNQKQAYFIGKSYVVNGDADYLYSYMQHEPAAIEKFLRDILKQFVLSSMHTGLLLPIDAADRDRWCAVQERSDQEDARILGGVMREAAVEDGVVVHTVEKGPLRPFDFPKPTTLTLANGLKILSYHNPNVPKVELVLSLKAKQYYDPVHLQGLYRYMTKMIYEGTQNYTGQQLAAAFENRGMSLSIKPGGIAISCLSQDCALALALLTEVVSRATLPEAARAKVADRLRSSLDNFWDEPTRFIEYLARKQVYGQHPYAYLELGESATIDAITREDLLNAYRTYMTPQEAVLAIVGDIADLDLQALLAQTVGTWSGSPVQSPSFSPVEPTQHTVIDYPMNRDQIVLAYAGKSIARSDERYDKILLFDQIFTGSTLGTMSSRLFALRERSGLFYTIGGSLLSHSDQQPGMIYIRTIVSGDRLLEAERAIEQTIAQAAQNITDDEFDQARDALCNSMVDNFESNAQIAYAFLFLERFGLPHDYFDTRAEMLMKIDKEELPAAIESVVRVDDLVKIRVGRLEPAA